MEFHQIINKTSLVLFSFLLCFLTYRFCYFVAEKYFFDKFFYQKSVSHGYQTFSSKHCLEDFGERANGLTLTDNQGYQPQINNLNNDPRNFQIIVIGDSFTWGQGITNNQRFAKILSDKLNKIRPTKVISMALPGWNILDYLEIYSQTIKIDYSPDLTIFALVQNDNIVNKPQKPNPTYKAGPNAPIVQECLQLNPGLSPTFNLNFESLPSDNKQAVIDKTNESWNNPVNSCVINNSLKLLPHEKAIYFFTDNYQDNSSVYKMFSDLLNKNNKTILSSIIGKNIPKYSKCFNNPHQNFFVSSQEGHPNALANQMYADILFNEITTNPKWNFKLR